MSTQLLCSRMLRTKAKSSFFRAYTSKVYKEGDCLHGYRVKQTKHIPEFELTAITLEHENTGAQHLHINREDSNNVFAVGFHTPVTNSTGVPHILEHTTLCGSKHYPVRDPFFKMLNRSLATFMNAFTANDYTFYPFATTNIVDYSNLRNVYMDAVFQPSLKKQDFRQEGWRLEHTVPSDPNTPIQFKGVVYNEMKGQMSDTNYLYYTHAQQALFDRTPYAHSSGGDPHCITDLAYEDLLKFHKQHYHPSNAHFYTYGNFELESHLSAIGEQLKSYKRMEISPVNKVATPWSAPRMVTSTFPLDPLSPADKQNKLSLSFLTNDSNDLFETFSMNLLGCLLLDGHASPVYKALIDTGLGSEFSANTGYDSSTRTSSLSIGLQGVKDSDVSSIYDHIQSVLEKVKREGFDPKRIEAAIHQVELGQKHKTADFGLTLMNGITSGWFNGANPIDLLELNKNIDRLKQGIAQGNFFESRIEKYLLNNPHTLRFHMKPDTEYSKKLTTMENAALERKINALTDEDKISLQTEGKTLEEAQNRKEDLSCLPTLQMSDISRKTKRVVLDHSGICNTPVQWRTTATNGITYFRAISTLPALSEELKIYLPLFCDSLLSLGTQQQSMAEIDEEIRLYTGGLKASTLVSTSHSDIDIMEEGITLSGSCLDRNVDKMYSLFTKLVSETNFDNTEKLKTLIVGNASGLINSIAESGHGFAHAYAASTLTPSMYTSELLGGMTQVNFMSQLAAKEDLTDVVSKLKAIASAVLKQSSLRVAITCGEEAVSSNEKALSRLISSLPEQEAPSATEQSVFVPKYKKTFFPLPFAVNFSAQAFRGVPYTHPDGVKLQLLSSLMTNHYLHREIREKNGAYGGGARYSGNNGLFSFYSYRDPNTLTTLDTYRSAIEWVAQQSFTEQQITEAKLSVFQSIDAPHSVSEEGMHQFVSGISDEMRQVRREMFLGVTDKDIKSIAQSYLSKNEELQYSVAVLGEDNEKIANDASWCKSHWQAQQ
ncbi:peptidase M16C associated-domain-containing protein [Spinellus fusiger]|nr:peptidase M16C associated-domain-containing protein [Spinellus fusiger]